MTKNTLINICVVSASAVLILAGLELLVWLNPPLYCEGYRPSRNEKLIYELQPGYKIASLKAKISSQGLNDRYFPVNKQPGVYRIAVIGDSTSFGWKVGPANSFPKQLENILNEREGPGKRFEVINFSVPGYSTSQEYEALKDKALKFSPDMVILCYCGNDVQLCDFIQPDITVFNFLYNKSYLVRYILKRIDLKIALAA